MSDRKCPRNCSMPNCLNHCEMVHCRHPDDIDDGDGDDEVIVHMCAKEHKCSHTCQNGGYCRVDSPSTSTAANSSSASGTTTSSSMKQEGYVLPCAVVLKPYQRDHPSPHQCTPQTVNNNHKNNSSTSKKQWHSCTARCPSCLTLCSLEYGHEGLHDTKHGQIINGMFVTNARATSREVDIQYLHPKTKQQRSMKFYENQDGTKFTCDMYCRVLGRGHTHLIQCSHKHPKTQLSSNNGNASKTTNNTNNTNNNTNSNTNGGTGSPVPEDDETCPYDGELSFMAMGRRHNMKMSQPSRNRLIDELRHDKFWELCGFVDPTVGKEFVTEETIKSFNLCRVTSKHKQLGNHNQACSQHGENYCTRHVNHDSLDVFSPNYLEDISLLAERFSSGGLSPSGHHFSYSYAYHHYILIDASKNMSQDDIIPSLKLFAPSTASTISSGTPHDFIQYYNRMGHACEIVLRYLHVRYKLNSQDRFTVIAFNKKSAQVLIEDETMQYFYSFIDLMLERVKQSDKIGFKNGFDKLFELLQKHSPSNMSMKLQPKVLLVSGGKMEVRKKTTSVSGAPKWHSLRLKRNDSKTMSNIQNKAEFVLSKVVSHLNEQHHALYGDQYFSPEESAHFTIVKVGVMGNDSRLKQFLVVGREAMTMIDSGIMQVQLENDYYLEMQKMNSHNQITLESDNPKTQTTLGLQTVASKLVSRVIGDLLLPFEKQCELNENIRGSNGGLLVKTHMHQVDERKQQDLTEQQLKSLAERDNLAREILTTERSYVTSLAKLIELYYFPLSKQLTHLMSDSDRSKIFSGLLNIYKLHKTLIEKVEERLSRWNDTQKIGDIFYELSPMFMVYTQFTTKYEMAIETFTQQNKSLMNNFLYMRRKDPYAHHHTLNSFLIMPIQRIPRYKMLLEGLLKHTEETHPDRTSLVQAVAEMGNIADYLNSKIRERQNFHKMKLIAQKIIGVKDLILPNRRYLSEFVVRQRLNSQMVEECILFLFNDLVLHCVQKVDELPSARSSGKRSLSLRRSTLTLTKSRSMTTIADNAGTDNNDIDIMGILEDDNSGITYEARYAFTLSHLQVHPMNFSKTGDVQSRFQVQYNHPSVVPQTIEYITNSEEEKTKIVTLLNESIAEEVKRNHNAL